jgi:Fur family ferric uptake transcriptional regulator
VTDAVATALPEPWASVGGHLRQRGLRWTPQRRQVSEVLATSEGHVTGAEIVERCRRLDPATVPSTVYRTLDVLEDLGFVRHGHGANGQEEYHVQPTTDHGHLHCASCGRQWELSDDEASAFVASIERGHGFQIDLSHLTLVGRCPDCSRA